MRLHSFELTTTLMLFCLYLLRCFYGDLLYIVFDFFDIFSFLELFEHLGETFPFDDLFLLFSVFLILCADLELFTFKALLRLLFSVRMVQELKEDIG